MKVWIDQGHTALKVILQLTFPERQCLPSGLLQFNQFLGVPLLVPAELLLPESDVRFRHRQVAVRAPVPEAAVHEDRQSPTGIADVRPAGGLLPMEPITGMSGLSECLPEQQLRPRVLALVAPHRL